MTEEKILKKILNTLNKLKIPYALTGGIAASFYGRPRSTHDFDLILQIQNETEAVKNFLKVFEKDFYVSEEALIDAILHKTMFNMIHNETSLKIDMWILKNDEYDQEAFRRRKTVNVLNLSINILTPEDMIINKLLWHKISGNDKHFNDAKNIFMVQKDNLHNTYLLKWIKKLSLTSFENIA
jgi:hypothetical protein